MVSKKLLQISTKDMSRSEWLQQRRKSIGGSDAAGIIGLSKWSSPYKVWADKTGRLPDTEDTEPLRLGRDLEAYVAQRFTEATGKKVRRWQAMLYNPDYPFAHADIDRWVIGENAGLECKTTSTLDTKQFKGVEFPEKYYAQCVHYMAVTGADRWYLAVLVFGRDFYIYTLERDQAEIDALMAAERDFWPCVETDTPPAPDGAEATTDTLTTIYAESMDTGMELFGRETMLTEYSRLKEQRKAIDSRIGEIENTIKNDMKEAERGSCGSFKVLWKTQERRSFQTRAFEKAYPDIDLTPFYKTSTARPFKVTEFKEE